MFLKLILIITSVAFVLGDSVEKSRKENCIVGGKVIDIKNAPWQASMQTPSGVHYCGASIISEKWLITAAHCSNLGVTLVIVGTSERNKSGTTYKVKLDRKIEFNEDVQPIELIKQDREVADGTMCLVTGWGKTLSQNESNLMLRSIKVPISNFQKCFDHYKNIGMVTPRMLCAGFASGKKEACQGDSGGPLVSIKDKVLVGVTSWGHDCTEPNLPGVYSRLSTVRNWIHEKTGI